MEAVAAGPLTGVTTTLGFLWDSPYGLIFGFLLSAVAQVAFSRGAIERSLGPGLRGIATGTAFGIVASGTRARATWAGWRFPIGLQSLQTCRPWSRSASSSRSPGAPVARSGR